jgi:localization factor PodJL
VTSSQSYKWFAIAANDGDKDAAVKRDEVFNALRPEQVEAARAAVANWTAEPINPDANEVEVPAAWQGASTETASVDMSKAIRNIQAILNNNGFDAGPPDGVMGKRTVSAPSRRSRHRSAWPPTGEIDDRLVQELLARNG